ncbi:hypothetical protein [Natrinema sp. DC36]|uniref:hypothetical protein n=1 Tax=Natrinema sp. DC36 TaxID=2878680 RepID=UPI001CF045EB|nr:hypothetical protein [Natrinema sp. DC36]
MTDDNLQIELDEETSNQLEAARGLMMYQDDGEVPSNENVIGRAIAFYLEAHDVVRSDGEDKTNDSTNDFLSGRPPGSLPESDLDLGRDPTAGLRGRRSDD